MRLLENEAGLSIARVEAIQRQKGRYRKAVEMISRGHEIVCKRTNKTGLLAGYDMLDKMGKIKEAPRDERHEILAKQYLKSEGKSRSTLVVAPTHAEAGAVTAKIRDGLRAAGTIEADEHKLPQLRSYNLSEAMKGDAATYAGRDGDIVQFHQNCKGGFKRGERYSVGAVVDGAVQCISVESGQQKPLPLENADRFDLYNETELGVAVGDKVRFSLGGTGTDGKQRISNGRLDEVKGFDKAGNLLLKSGFTVDRDYGHLDLGYVVTSHASQGKDRKLAIAAMGAESLPAINAKQFYVTVSRGSEDVAIYVDDKSKVRRAIERSGDQLSATELTSTPSKSPAPHSEREMEYEQRYGMLRSFRDRVTAWYQEFRQNGAERESVGRHRNEDVGRQNELGMAMGPELGRSR
jgi:hypothetical protein